MVTFVLFLQFSATAHFLATVFFIIPLVKRHPCFGISMHLVHVLWQYVTKDFQMYLNDQQTERVHKCDTDRLTIVLLISTDWRMLNLDIFIIFSLLLDLFYINQILLVLMNVRSCIMAATIKIWIFISPRYFKNLNFFPRDIFMCLFNQTPPSFPSSGNHLTYFLFPCFGCF